MVVLMGFRGIRSTFSHTKLNLSSHLVYNFANATANQINSNIISFSLGKVNFILYNNDPNLQTFNIEKFIYAKLNIDKPGNKDNICNENKANPNHMQWSN